MPFNRRGTGDFSRLTIRALAYAETMQGMALDSIREQFGARELFDITDGITYGDFIKAMTEAEESGTREEFEAMLGRQIVAMMQAQAQATAEAQAQGAQ